MPSPATCTLVWPTLAEPPVALRTLYQQLQRGEPLAPALEAVRATRATPASRAKAQDRDANGAHEAGAAAIAAHSNIVPAAPPSAASPPELQPTLQLLLALVALLATPLPVACHSCATRATALQQQLQDNKGGGDGLQQALAALQLDTAAEADVAGRDLTDHADDVDGAQPLISAARLAIHTRMRLTMEPPSFQLNFLRALPDLLLPVAANGAAAANKPHPLHVQLRSLLRAYTRELDFRVDEEALLLHCGLIPPPAASSADSLFSDPSVEGCGGLYFPSPPELLASRLFGFHAPILHALRDLVSADPSFAPIELSQSQQRYFKDQWLASPPAADEMAELVNLLKAQDLAATFASASAASSTAMDAIAAQPLAFPPRTDATWLRFVPGVGGEESVLAAAEAACAEARAARRQRRREKREAAEQEQKQQGEQRTDGTVTEQNLEEKKEHTAAASDESSSKIPHDDDDDIIMLSQAPYAAAAASAGGEVPAMLDDSLPSERSRSATVATAGALPVSSSSVRPRRHSADLSSTRSSSGASTPASTGTGGARAQDPVEVAARQIFGGDADALQREEEFMPAFDEPDDLFVASALEDDENAWDADWWDSSQQPASQHAQLAAAAPVISTISLDDAFAEASQRVRQQATLSASQEAKEEKHATDGQMEEDVCMDEDDTLQPKSPVAVSRPSPASSPPPVESLLTQLDMLRSSLLSDAMVAAQPTIISALSSLLAEEDGAAITPASVLSVLQSRRDLAHLYSKLASVAAVVGRFRDCASASEFDAACARADLASLESPPSSLLFFALFLDSNLAHARVRTLLSSAVLPTLRAQLRGKNTSVNKDATGCLLLLVLRGHEEALVHSVLVPLLVETMNSVTAAADAPDASATFDLLKSLFWEPKSQQKQQQQRTAGKSAAAPRALSASSRLLLLQHFCSCSLRRFEPQARSNPNSFRWSDAEQSMLMTGFLDSRGSGSSSGGGGADVVGLPAPHPEHHASLLALATGISAVSHVLPQLLSASSASVSSSHAQSAGDVGALLLACMILACANESLRKQSAFTLLLLAYANMARGLTTAPLLQQAVKALSGQLGGMLGKRFLSAIAKANNA
jgi:hypothetical protein